jgi:hypothetical protein
MLTRRELIGLIAAVTLTSAGAAGCNVNKALEEVSEGRHLAADLQVQFSRAADASSRAVMADSDEASVAFAREAEQAKEAILKDSAALKAILQKRGYSDETRLLQEFDTRFVAYRKLDATILELAVLNTNLKARALSFGPALQEADAFRDALQSLTPRDAANTWHLKAVVATAIAAVREIHALQAPHIAEADDEAMTRIEQRMKTADEAARSALESLRPLVSTAMGPKVAAAGTALGRFDDINARILALSRRNTNVRSLVLSLNEKTKLTAACDETLRALREGLTKRAYRSSRYPVDRDPKPPAQ